MTTGKTIITLLLGIFLFITAPALAQNGVLDKAKNIEKAKHFSTKALAVCIETARMQARQQGADFDLIAAEKSCRGRHVPGTENNEELDDLYQICRLRPTYGKFQQCMIDATSVPEQSKK